MPIAETTITTRVLSEPLLDLYKVGKVRFERQLEKWKNANARKALAKKVAQANKVKTFWQRDKEVSLSSFYFPSKVCFTRGTKKDVSSLRDFPMVGNFVIQGTVGQGKSIFLRYLCVQELKEAGSGRIPVFIELRALSQDGLRAALFRALENLGFEINEELFKFYADSGKLVVLLDAFDELDASLIKPVILELELMSEKHPGLQIIVTSRPDSDIQNSRFFRVAHLAPLQPEDHGPFFKRIGISEKKSKSLLDAISSSSSEISTLLSTPLMLTLLSIVYQAESAIPNELPDFFESLFQTLFTKHDKAKPGLIRTQKSGLGERKLQHLFQGFCFSTLLLAGKTILSNEEFHKSFEKATQLTGLECDPDGFKHDMTKVVCLLQEDGYELHFIHKSVLEFYAASFVRSANEEVATKFYTQLAEKAGLSFHKWQQVLQFLSKIDKYRHAKYFAIQLIRREFKILGVDDQVSPSKANWREMINRVFNETVVTYSLRNGKLQVTHLGPVRQWSSYLNPLNHVINSLFENRIEFDTEADLLKRYPSATKAPSGRYASTSELDIPWNDVATEKQITQIVDESAAQIKNVIELLHSLEEYVQKEEHKSDLLVF